MAFGSWLLAGLLVLNAFIAWWNAKQAGKIWLEAHALGRFPLMLAWSAAIQSACGFTVVIGFLLALLASACHWLPPKYVQALLSLEYLIVVVPALGSGLVILLHSWILAFRQRSLANLSVATYNTLAMGQNVYDAATHLPSIFDNLSDLFSGSGDKDDDNNLALVLVCVLALAALAGGILLTVIIVQANEGTLQLPERTGKGMVPVS
jgi:hypothetical protein